jgi:DNA repair protein RadA/Sms
VDEPGADLAVALAIASAARGVPVQPATAAFGELGLTGRLRPAAQARRRLEECAKLGIRTVLAPTESPKSKGVRVVEADTLRAALGSALANEAREAA